MNFDLIECVYECSDVETRVSLVETNSLCRAIIGKKRICALQVNAMERRLKDIRKELDDIETGKGMTYDEYVQDRSYWLMHMARLEDRKKRILKTEVACYCGESYGFADLFWHLEYHADCSCIFDWFNCADMA